MSAISLKSITGITSITTPTGVDNQLTLHTNDTTQRVKVTQSGIEVVGVATFQDVDVDGHTNLDNVSIAGVTTHVGNVLIPNDTGKILLGASQDLQFYHDFSGGSENSHIAQTTNKHLQITAYTTFNRISGTWGVIKNSNSHNIIRATAGSDVKLYFNNGEKLATAGHGINITGGFVATGDCSIADKITHAGDENTSIRFPAADTFTVETAGSERLRITSSGLVQIGLSGMSGGDDQALVVNNPSGNNKVLELSTSNASGRINCSRTLSDTLNTTSYIEWSEPGAQGTGDLRFGTSSGSNNPIERLRITSGGSLLVGKTVGTMATAGTRIDPQSTLITGSSTSTNLATASGAALSLINNSATDNNFSNIGGYNSNSLVTSQINFVNTSHSSRTGDITFMTHNGSSMPERLRIDSSGNVLVGTTDSTIYNNGDSASEGIVLRNGEVIDIARKGDLQLTLNRQTNDGPHIGFYRSGGVKSFISTRDNAFCIDVNSTNERLRITDTGRIDILGDGGNAGFTLSNAYGQAGFFGGMYYNGSSWTRNAIGTRKGAGMYVNTGGHVAFLKSTETSGTSATVTESLRITSEGNVSINTTADVQKLRVYDSRGAAGYKTALFESNDTANGTRIVFANTGNTSGRGLGINVGGQTYGPGQDKASFGWYNADNTFVTHSIMTLTAAGKIGMNNTDPGGRTGCIDTSSNDGTSGKTFADMRGHSSLILRNPSTTHHSFTQLLFENGGGTSAATMFRHRLGGSHGSQQNFVGDLCLFRRTGNAGSGAADFRESTRWCGANAEARQVWWAYGDSDTSNTNRLGWHHLSAQRDHPGTDAYSFFRLETGAASYARGGFGKYTCVWTTGHASGYGLATGHFGYYMHHGNSRIYVNEHIIYRERYSNGSYYGWDDGPNLRICNSTDSGGTNACIVFRCGGRRYSGGYDMSVMVGLFIELYAPESANGDTSPRLYVAGNSQSNLDGGGFGSPVNHDYVTFQSSNPNHSGQP